jgi:DGQHR domain-containing protein
MDKNKKKDKEKKEKGKGREKESFFKKIINIFTTAGFNHLDTEGKQINDIGHRIFEIDFVLVYENIILICEDTSSQKDSKDHIRSKKEAFSEIKDNFPDYLKWLIDNFPNEKDMLNAYSVQRYKIFFLYFSQHKLNLTDDDYELYSDIKFVAPQTVDYFYHMAQCIKKSVIFEIFRFLELKSNEIRSLKNQTEKSTIEVPIIYPNDITGFRNGIRIVSFMISAKSLLKTCYVLRKDNWEDSTWLYQRLIDQKKIKNIRKYLASKGTTFFNNIIVALPDDILFLDSNNKSITLEEIKGFSNCQKMLIPNEINSICIIDGQHRVLAHYENIKNDETEKIISQLRKNLHLLVTGLIFPSNMENFERLKIQSEIFLDINSNAKPVQPGILLHIQRLNDPFTDSGIAKQVIEKLNKEEPFKEMLEISTLDKGKIKTTSIVKFALQNIVSISPKEEKNSFFTYWNGNKNSILEKNEDSLSEYIDFISKKLIEYFKAIKKCYVNEWNDSNSKILSVTSINGFIIALNRQMKVNGIKDFEFYKSCFSKMNIDFSKENFEYTSSQYRMFSNNILTKAFELDINKY